IDIGIIPIGTYNFTIEISDSSENKNRDEVIVFMVDKPVFTSIPNDISYVNGTTGNEIYWTISTSSPDSYTIFRDSASIDQGNWTSGVPIFINVDGLDFGIYNYTILANNSNGDFNNDTMYVTVTDLPKWISNPLNATINEGEINNYLEWNVTDALPDTYEVYRNGQLNFSGNWSNADNIIFNIDTLERGFYNYTIIVYDGSGNTITDTVFVTVYDITNPLIDNPTDRFLNEGTTGNVLSWIASDLHPGNYTIYKNGTEEKTEIWVSNENVTFNIDNLLEGTYNFTIIIRDDSGNFINDSIIVTVYDATAPTVNLFPGNTANYVEGAINNTLYWQAFDSYHANYIILKNGSQV
ncbi:MAG: Ig-like domain-containing protein, partial [Candidatus Heimdallarchaeota archaeon]